MNNGNEATELVRGPLSVESNLHKFQSQVEKKYGLKFDNYEAFYCWSCKNYSKLWKEVWDFLDIICSRTYDEVVDESTKFDDVPEWFRGAKLNYAENVLRYPHDDHVVIITTGEEQTTPEYVTFGQLRKDVALLSAAFRSAGIKQGDTIACFISNRKEPIVALLAAASVGALFSAVNPLMGTNAIVSRFQQISPKVLFTIDRFVHDSQERDVLSMLPEIVRNLPTLKHVIIVPSKENSLTKDFSSVSNVYFLPEFLKKGLTPEGNIPPPKYDQLPFNHPLVINYTSGTTGPPKGIVHSAGATMLNALSNLSFHFNMQSTEVILGIYSTGWITWNAFMAAIGLGATLLLYEGLPFYRSQTYFWDLIDKHKVSTAFLTPSVLEEMEKRNFVPGKHNSLKTLHTLISGSSRLKAHTYDFVHQKVKRDVFFSDLFGSTEFMGMFAGPNHLLPVYKQQVQARSLGVELCSYNDEGKPVLDERGELVITNPFPSMPLYFWNDESKEQYKNTYFSKFPGVWCHGDICVVHSKTGGLSIYGRSDETIKQRETRFGSAEIYNAINQIDDIADSICVSKKTSAGDDVAFLFVKVKEGFSFNYQLVEKIKNVVQRELSAKHVPEVILSAPAIPYNLNGKKMEVLVKKILAGAHVNRENVSNPDCLPFYDDASKMGVI